MLNEEKRNGELHPGECVSVGATLVVALFRKRRNFK
jgi:hypothetical protein